MDNREQAFLEDRRALLCKESRFWQGVVASSGDTTLAGYGSQTLRNLARSSFLPEELQLAINGVRLLSLVASSVVSITSHVVGIPLIRQLNMENILQTRH